jgi:hypothetical protein
MGQLDDFINALHDEADAVMGTRTMAVESQSFPVVAAAPEFDLTGIEGGLDDQRRLTAVAQPSDVTGAAAMSGKRCTVDGDSYRIERVEAGDVAITFRLISIV